MRRVLALTLVAVLLGLSIFPLAGCAAEESADSPASNGEAAGGDATADGEPVTPEGLAWLDTELTDAVTGKTYRISDFKGEPVLLHAFAVW